MKPFDLLLLLSRLTMIFGWSWAAVRLWKFRHMPHGNHVLAAAVAMVLSQGTLLLRAHVRIEILIFFMAMAQLTLVISFVRVTWKNVKENVKTTVGKLASFGLVLASIGNLLLSAR